MAVEVAGTSLHWSHPPLPPFTSLSHKTLPFPFRSTPHLTVHRSCFLGAAVVIHRSHQIGGRRRRAPASSSASLDGFGFVDDGEDEFVKRINDLISPKFKTEAEPRMKQDEETSESDLPSVSSSEIRSMRPSCFDLPLSLRILKQNKKKKKKKRRESTETTDSACSSVKKAFSSMVFIVRELQIHSIRMREALFSSSNLQIQGILARVLDELHSSFVWLFQRIFSTTPTLMLSLMLLLANFTIFSISDLPPAADAQPPPQSLSAAVQESPNPNPRFDSSALKSLSVGRSSAGGGAGGGGKNAQAIAGAADDGRWDRWSSSFHEGGTIAAEVASSDEKAWKGIAEEAERIRARGRHEALLDSDTLRRFVSPVTVELEPDDLSAYADTELSYRRALAEGLDDPLILSNFAQFLYVVLRDHDGAEEYFKRAILAKPADPEVLSRYANFLWVGRKDLGAAEETFLEAIEADPGNTYHSANYAHFLWSTGGDDTCYPPDACDS